MRNVALSSVALLVATGSGRAIIAPDPHLYGVPALIPTQTISATRASATPFAATIPSRASKRALSTFQATAIQPFTARIDPDTGFVRQLAAGRTRGYGGPPQDAARAFLRDARALFGPAASEDSLAEPTITPQDWGHQVVFEQRMHGIPVLDRAITVNLNSAGEVILADNATEPLPEINTTPAVSALRVAGMATGLLTEEPTLAIRVDGLEPRLVWRFIEIGDTGIPIRVTVDANAGYQIERTPLARFATGQGLLYPANPTSTPARQMLPLDSLSGDGSLTGDYTKVHLIQKPGGIFTPAQTATNSGLIFNFAPDTEELAQTQAYYGITRMHDWFKQTFNFTGRDHQIPGFVRDDTQRNAFFSSASTYNGFPTPNGQMVFGYGSSAGNPVRDWALDTDILYHEYGHAVMNILSPSFGGAYGSNNAETGGLNEGTADYLSSTVLNDPVLGEYVAVATGKSYYRDLTARFHYPEEVWSIANTSNASGVLIPNVRRRPEVHQTGAIWAASVWDLRILLGSQKSDQIVFKATSLFNATSDFQSALGALLTADDLLYGGADKPLIREVLQKRGITETAYPVSYIPYTAFYSSTGPSKIHLGQPYIENDIAYILPISPLPSYDVGEPYFFTAYVYDGGINTVVFVLKDANDSVVARVLTPVQSFNAYGSDGVYYRYSYIWDVAAFPTSLIPAGQKKLGGLRLYIHSYVENRATVEANFDTLTPKAAAPDAGMGYPAELLVPQVTPAVYSSSLGDTDGNGKVELRDALLVTRSIAGLAALDGGQKTRADIASPQNGNPDFVDARVILQRAGGLL